MAQPDVQAGGLENPTGLPAFYLHIVEAVVQSVREDFQTEGYDDNTLAEFRQLWELKLTQAGAFQDPEAELRNTQLPDQFVPHGLSEDLQFDSLEALLSQSDAGETSSASGPVGQSYQLDSNLSFGKPAAFMKPPAPWMNRKFQDVDVKVELNMTSDGTREENGGAQIAAMEDMGALAAGKRKRANSGLQSKLFEISQLDGAGDLSDIFQDVAEEDYNEIGPEGHDGSEECRGEDETTHDVPDMKPPGQDTGDQELPLNEDDDDDEDFDLDEIDPGDECDNLVLAQFEKVTKTKKTDTWKCIFKDGIMNLNTKDYLFSKGLGEFKFEN